MINFIAYSISIAIPLLFLMAWGRFVCGHEFNFFEIIMIVFAVAIFKEVAK